MSLTKDQRNGLVQNMLDIKLELGDLNSTKDGRKLSIELDGLHDKYSNTLPETIISCCPYCNTPLKARIDIYGLDGPFWKNTGGSPISYSCRHYLTFLGALHYNGFIPTTKESGIFNEIHSGPEVPYVVPKLLENNSVKAILYALPLIERKYTAYITAYFSESPLPSIENHQVWLRQAYYYTDSNGHQFRDSRNDTWDFDIRKWLNIKPWRVGWILPEYKSNIHKGVVDCPYIDVQGRRNEIVCRRGDMRELPAPDGSELDLFD